MRIVCLERVLRRLVHQSMATRAHLCATGPLVVVAGPAKLSVLHRDEVYVYAGVS